MARRRGWFSEQVLLLIAVPLLAVTPVAVATAASVVGVLGVAPPSHVLTINDVSVTEGDSGTTLAIFTVTLSDPSSVTASVQYSTANGTATAGSDYVAKSGTLTFSPGTTSQTISVTVINDTTAEPDETFFVKLFNATNATIADGQGQGGQGTIQNDDPAFSIDPSGSPNPVDSGGTVDLSVTATDTLGHSLNYSWTASCPTLQTNGTFDKPGLQNPTWTPPSNTTGGLQSCAIQVVVSDGTGLTKTGTYSQWVQPIVDDLAITGGPSGSPNPVDSGGTVDLSVTAKDILGHSLNYSWTASCPTLQTNGTFDKPGLQNPTWTAPSNTTGGLQSCAIQVVVSDGTGLTKTGTYSQSVQPIDLPIATITSLGSGGRANSLAIGSDGLPIISYWDDVNDYLVVRHCVDVVCSSANIRIVDSQGVVGAATSIAIGADGLPVIAYRDDTNGDLRVAHCADVSCREANLITVDNDRNDVATTVSMAIGADGLPVIAYRDLTNFDLRVAHCDDAACIRVTLTTVDRQGDVGDSTSIAIGADNLPVISYRDGTNGDLKVAHCNDAVCATAFITTVDSTGNVGFDTSIAIGTDGLAVIAYRDSTNGDLKVAHCDDAICSEAAITAVDNQGVVGLYTSIAIGEDKLPVISYYDLIKKVLKVAHCNNPKCTGP